MGPSMTALPGRLSWAVGQTPSLQNYRLPSVIPLGVTAAGALSVDAPPIVSDKEGLNRAEYRILAR